MQGSLGSIIWTICYLAVLIGLSAYGIHRYVIIYLFLKNRKASCGTGGPFQQLPKVTMQLPIFNEVYVVERLLKSVSEIDYPRNLLQIQVLDDSTDETRELTAMCVENLQSQGFNVELIHRSIARASRPGRWRPGLASAEGDFVCILDSDFVPQPDLLRKTIHFFTDPKVGMIQTRWGHLNRGYSLLTRVQAMFLDGHLLLEQTARSRSGRFFNFNGTAGLWRRSCIEQAGGWQHDTLTEDLDLSYRAQLAGWKFIFLPDVITPAELPGGHEWLQVAATPLDEGFDPDLQEIASDHLAERSSAHDQNRGDGAFDLKLRIPFASLFMRASPSLKWWAAGRLGSDVTSRYSDLSGRIRLCCRLLCVRATRIASADLDEGNAASSLPARAGRRPLA